MARQELHHKFVEALESAPPGERAEYWDTIVPGFGVRVTDRGVKTWVVYTRWPGVGPARRKVGSFEKMKLAVARKIAKDWLELAEQGVDPAAQRQQRELEEQQRKQTTFGAVAEAWFADELKRTRKAKEVERDVRREFADWWSKPVTDVTGLMVIGVIKAKAAKAPAQARNLLGYAKRLFGWALEQQVYGIAENPAERLKPKKIVGKKLSRKRVLNDAELRAYWHAAADTPYPYGPIFQLLALTGQRKSEVAEARWREFDLKKKVWIIPAERMKMDAPHVVPLSDDALEVLSKLHRFKKGDHLFSTNFGARPVNGFSKPKERIDDKMLAALGEEPEHWVIHDVRRTMRTNLSALPIPDIVRELVIAHAQKGLHAVYDQHAYFEEKKRAMELWAARLRDIVDPPKDNPKVARPKFGGKR